MNESIMKKAVEKNIIEVNIYNIRDFSTNKHKKVDDTPYGGGAGMAFMGMGMQAGSGMMQGMQQPTQTAQNPFINVGGQGNYFSR